MDPILASVAAMVAGAVASALSALFQRRSFERKTRSQRPDLEDRLASLGSSLAAASQTLEEARAEIQARIALADKAKQDAQEATELAQLSEAQRQAVARLVRAEVAGVVTKSSRKSLWQTALVNFLFFLAGVGASWITAQWL